MRLKLNLPKMPRKYKQFYRREMEAAVTMGMKKDVRFSNPWMFENDGENRCHALAWVRGQIVWAELRWGKVPGLGETAVFEITRENKCLVHKWLVAGGTEEAGESRLADFVMFGEGMGG